MLLFHTTWDVCIRRYGRCRDTKGTKASAGSGGTGRNAEVSGKYGKPYAADAVCEFICGQKEAAQEEA